MTQIKNILRKSPHPLIFAFIATSCGGLTTDIVTPITGDPAPATYALTLTAGAGGTAAPIVAGPYVSGTTVILDATPDSGNVVASWTGALNEPSSAAQNQVIMTSDKTVSVAFTAASAQTYTLAHSAGTGGTLTVSPDQASYADGTVVTLTATPASGFQIYGWTGTDNNTLFTSPNQITMTGGNQTVSVAFGYALTYYTPDNWGTLAFSPTGHVSSNVIVYPAGTAVTVTATALAGDPWRYGCTYLGNTQTDVAAGFPGTLTAQQSMQVTMNAAVTLNAFFPYKTDMTGKCPESTTTTFGSSTVFPIHP